MPKILDLFTELTARELQKLARKEHDPRIRQRLLGIWHLRCGKRIPQAAEAIGLAQTKLRKWVHRFNQQGLEGLRDQPRPGQPTRLDRALESAFRERIRQGPTESDGVVRFRAIEVQRILREEFDAEYGLGGTYFLLHRLGFSSLSPRPIHPKADKKAQDVFKKRHSRSG